MDFSFFQDSGWATFIGRFHPILVHLPIGFLLIAALLEVGRRMGRIQVNESTISFVLFWAAVGATFSCIAGYLLSLSGGYDEALLSDHKWQGIGVAAFAWIAWLVKSDFIGERIPFGPLFYLPAFALATVLTLTAGHHGGSLTHGDDYLTQYTPEPFRTLAGMEPLNTKKGEIQPIADIQQAVVYQDIVQPILEARCTQCHNASKKKGDLRMDEYAMLVKGGENGPIMVAGKGGESDMIKRCLLPESDDNHMPPKGKPQLTTEQITLLSWWIDQGAPADKKVAELTVSDPVKPLLAALQSGGAAAAGSVAEASAIDGLEVKAGDPQAIAKLTQAGLIVRTISAGQNLLEVSAVNVPSFNDQQMALLMPLADQVAWLKLGRTSLSDKGVAQISKLKNLNKLHLEYTGITDAGLAGIKALPKLEYINLVGTKVSDQGIKSAVEMKRLRSLYVWQTEVTDSVIKLLAKEHPQVVINNGMSEESIAAFVTAGDSIYSKLDQKKAQ
ncbi:cytochrome c [Dyadobacter jejuensis]|uniref:Cytochrome c n=1 Tax=Dyadobacter jejuensis TaxID=1082580 RepID=A0A316AI37_9BACT|nr:c-type cytochrome domain-containing protein [Dyadobacter jejuensis]PWJ56624.1 cytochrome c [Dyadobacter jejuensis]